MKLDIGSGNTKKEGFERMDIYPFENVTIVHDMEKTPYPIESDICTEIRMHHSLEHCSWVIVPKILNEINRIARKGAILNIEVPCLETAMKRFLELPETEKWGIPFEYIFGNQGKGQIGQQTHKSGFTESKLKSLVEQAGFSIINLHSYENRIKMKCIRLKAQKK